MSPLVAVLLQQMPSILAFARAAFIEQNPGAPVPTNAEVLAAYQTAITESLAEDADWLAQHGE